MAEHGTRSCYVTDRCRCQPCTVANTEAIRDYRARVYIPRDHQAPHAAEDKARRREVIERLVGAGMRSHEIARELDVCVRTVERYRAKIRTTS